MNHSDNFSTSWATTASDPYQRDPTAACLPCQTKHMPATRGTPAPPPAPGQAPCMACPPNATFAERRTVRDAGPPCCITEKYGNIPAWPWGYADGSSTPDTGLQPQLWQDIYEVKDRSKTGFAFSPVFNPYVL
jgi:hypothetical protein